MARICVVHHKLVARGGGEFLAINTIEAAKEAGHEVWLVSNDRSLKDIIMSSQEAYGKTPSIDRHIRPAFGLLSRFGKFSLYQRILVTLTAGRLLSKGAVDLVINTHGDMIPFTLKGRYILYCHYPTSVAIMESPRYRHFPLNLYAKPYAWLLRRWRPKGTEIILANSRFTKRKIKEVWGVDSEILYPPVDIQTFWNPNPIDREPTVVSVGRFTREKRYEVIIKAFSEVAKELPEAKLYLMGSSQATGALNYIRKLRELAKRQGIAKKVFIETDVPLSTLRSRLASSMVYVHAMVNEHFGISVVQAMAAGLVTIVHKSGGPFEDIIERGKWGFYFQDTRELASKIITILEDRTLWREYHIRSLSRCKVFDAANFKKGMLKFIEHALRIPQS